jgi:hypothetical protein
MSYIYHGTEEAGVFESSVIGYSILLYLLLFHTQSHLVYIGGYFSIFIGILEGLYLKSRFAPEMMTADVFCIATPCMMIVSISYTDINWKKKSLFFLASRMIIIFIY